MNLLSVMNISKTFSDNPLFHDISFSIDSGDRVGLIGVNGAGKSTLLKIIAGIETPDVGQISYASGARIEYLPQTPTFDPELTVLQSVFQGASPVVRLLGNYEQLQAQLEENPTDRSLQEQFVQLSQQMDVHNAWELEANAKTILTRLGVSHYAERVGSLSGGQRKRVAMARALIRPTDLLILDEPTNHIDNETVDWLESYLIKSKAALLLITHDRYFLDRVVNRMIELEKASVYAYSGNYSQFLELKSGREERLSASEDKRQNLMRRELEWLSRGAKARTTKQKARVEFAETLRDQAVDKPAAKLDMAIGSQRLGNKVLELEHISKSYGDRKLIDNLSYLVGPRDRIGIVGPNGSGKSTLLDIVAGRLTPNTGNVDLGITVKLAYYTQENVDLNEKQRVIECIREVAPYIHTTDGETISAGQMLERFLFPSSIQWTPISKLSGGEKRRVYLLRLLMAEPNVLLLDEPTNDLDIATLTIFEDYLDHFNGAVIAVSHDRYFLDRTVDRLLAFEGDGRIRFFQGMYSEYQAMRQATSVDIKQSDAKKPEPVTPTIPEARTNQESTNQRRKLSYREQQEFDGIEATISTIESKLGSVHLELAKASSDYTYLQKLTEEQDELQEQLDKAIERWTELSELIEEIARNKNL